MAPPRPLLSIGMCQLISTAFADGAALQLRDDGQQYSIDTLAAMLMSHAAPGTWRKPRIAAELSQAAQKTLKAGTGLNGIIGPRDLQRLIAKLNALASAVLQKGAPEQELQVMPSAADAQPALPLGTAAAARTVAAAPSAAGSVRTAGAADLAPREVPKRVRINDAPEIAPPPPGVPVDSSMAGVAMQLRCVYCAQGPRPQYASTNDAMAKLVSAAAIVEGATAEVTAEQTRGQARLGTPPPMHVAPPPQQQADIGAQAAVAATLHAAGIVFISELKKLDSRLAELYAIAAKDPETKVALLSISRASADAAIAAVAAACHCVRAGNNASDMQALVRVAVDKVNEVHETIRQSKERAAAFLRRCATAILNLRSCADSLQAANSTARAATLSESTMVEVRDAMTSAQAAVQACHVRTQRPITADMVSDDAVAADEEQAATAAVRKVAEAEAVVAREIAAERRIQPWRRVVRTMAVAATDYREVRAKNATDRQHAAAEAARTMALLRQEDASATAAIARPATSAPPRPASNHVNEETSNGAQPSGAGRPNGPNSRRNNALFSNRDRPAPAMSAGALLLRQRSRADVVQFVLTFRIAATASNERI
ncbi:hypothetical protein JKP88DRAFT_252830 [Tribonema minus]|uniref:Uncharacterized protein n=1 Tax=Tribonema minus TaxID=303371 RepID=A0A835ZFF3_9STRA|nr:hypothetical protein JKP88DRAFT_252830 [Tribonema minus]